MITDILGDFEDEIVEETENSASVVSPDVQPTEKEEPTEPVIVSDNATYTMEQAAKEIGTSPASLRAFLNELGEDVIAISRTLGGHRRLTYDNIEQIRRYYEIVRNNGMSVKQLKEVLNTQEGKILAKTNELEQLAELLQLFRSQTRSDLEEMARAIANQVVDNNKLMLEQKDNEREHVYNELKSSINEEASSKISDLEENLNKKIETLSSLIGALAEDNKKKDEEIAILKAQNEKILENTTKKRRWPFS